MVQSLNTEGLYWSRTTLAGTTTTQDTAAGGGAVKGGTQRWVQDKNLSANAKQVGRSKRSTLC